MKKTVMAFSILGVLYLILLGLYIKGQPDPAASSVPVPNLNAQENVSPASPSIPMPTIPVVDTQTEKINSIVQDRDIVTTADGREIGQRVYRRYVSVVDDWIYYYKEQRDGRDEIVFGEAGIYKVKSDGTGLTKVANTTYNSINSEEQREIIPNIKSRFISR